MDEQLTLFKDNPDYDAFVEKFQPKKTTDDCYTPPLVYAAVRDWACQEYGIDPGSIVRPFYPGGDYEHYPYKSDSVVLDNPPFSILSKICEFYLDRKIPFFLFAPSLTCFFGRNVVMRMNHICCDAEIVYENGAKVRTGFVTSYGNDIIAQTAPELSTVINRAVRAIKSKPGRNAPKYIYPNHVVTAAMLNQLSKRGVIWKIKRADCTPISKLDAQTAYGKTIFGGGLLLSDTAAAEKAAAEKAGAEKAAAEKAAAEKAAAEKAALLTTTWSLSPRELAIIKTLGGEEET